MQDVPGENPSENPSNNPVSQFPGFGEAGERDDRIDDAPPHTLRVTWTRNAARPRCRLENSSTFTGLARVHPRRNPDREAGAPHVVL